ncbi:hypothetical protein PILCRDRAFT_68800, partial [Piloderma croceum F 1598]
PMTSSQSRLDSLLDPLKIPQDFARYERHVETEIIASLEQWKLKTDACLLEFRNLALREASQFSIQDQGSVISTIASFEGDGSWITSTSREIAKEILALYPEPSVALIESILIHHVKPIFKSNPHPSLNLSTGRKLPETAGGPMGTQDYYEGQVWKRHPGVPNLVSWCVCNIQTVAYEGLWHLIIPPIMTLLDDYEAPYKIHGIKIVSELLQRVPIDLLKRTGIDGLLFTSLSTSLTNLHNPFTPTIIRTAIPTTLTLTNLSTPPGSQIRFDKLCTLLGDSIIGNVWIYASMEPECVQATLDVLPGVIEMLGVGCARYLKALIPQLIYPLLPSLVGPSREMQLSSLRALHVLIDECLPRMPRWKGTILDAVAKCWVGIIDSGVNDPGTRAALREVCSKLALVCPSLLQEEYPQLLSLDANMFSSLLGQPDDNVG